MSLATVQIAKLIRRSRGATVGMLLLGLATLVAGGADAGLVRDRKAKASPPRLVFESIARAWEAGDEQALADLVHADGLRVTTARNTARVSTYSPSQAYYYFRNLFQAYRTLLFEFEMMQDGDTAGPVHGMATWKRRRPDSEKILEVKLVCILVKQKDSWRLAEINTIR